MHVIESCHDAELRCRIIQQAKAEAKANISFVVCRYFFDLFRFSRPLSLAMNEPLTRKKHTK